MSKSPQKPIDNLIARSLSLLKQDFLVIGKERVPSFVAWPIIMFLVGVVVAVAFLASRSGTLEGSFAGPVSPPSIIVIWPNGGETWSKKSTQSIEWEAKGVGDVRIELVKDNKVVRRISRQTSADLGVYDWRMPAGQPTGDSYKVRITDLRKGVYDESDEVFRVVEADGVHDDPDNGQVSVPVISPDGGTFVNSIIVSLSVLTPDAQIYYTLDGTDPTPQSPLYNRPFVLGESLTVKARAFHDALEDSDIVSAGYIIEQKIGDRKSVV